MHLVCSITAPYILKYVTVIEQSIVMLGIRIGVRLVKLQPSYLMNDMHYANDQITLLQVQILEMDYREFQSSSTA